MSDFYKLSDYPGLNDFLDSESTATISVGIDAEGTLHGAALLYWHQLDPLQFYFVTGRKTEKAGLLQGGVTTKASCVVGTQKGCQFTLQMRGELGFVNYQDYDNAVRNYYEKRGNRNDEVADPDMGLLRFIPSWARFTDYRKEYVSYYLKFGGSMKYDEIKIFTDGGSRGNPGPAASGVVILTTNDEVIEAFGRYIGETTNNQAEWQAVVFALEEAKKYQPKRIHFFMDSELVCKQLNGQYKVKNIDLRPHFLKAVSLAQDFDVVFKHVYREFNKLADAEVNKSIDARADVTSKQ